MKPIDFPQRNKVLTKPANMTFDDECGSLFVHQSDGIVISCWKLSFWERFKALFSGRIWLGVWSGTTSPPVKLSTSDLF